ncbi:MAG: pyruvate, phosphate dikinase, partial [Spirochaetes bacterium]|nr:pyruvate, phosphate dikinase [Spirochaetota bacterium]
VVSTKAELDHQKEIVESVYAEVCKKYGVSKIDYLFGTMIEIPRAALAAGKIAETAEFFSFGTNDLTQMGFGFSRDDIGGFVPDYLAKRVLPADPFQVLDQEGIGELIAIGIERGRKTRRNLKVGICGEHGGEPSSVEFCHRVGMDYVSCSPFRVPIARLAAAQAAIRGMGGKGKKDKPAAKKPAKAAKVMNAAKPATNARKAAAKQVAKAKPGKKFKPVKQVVKGKKATLQKKAAVKKPVAKKPGVKKATVKKPLVKKPVKAAVKTKKQEKKKTGKK